mgnify:CR=1 FL=1
MLRNEHIRLRALEPDDLALLYIGDKAGEFGGIGDVTLSVDFDEELKDVYANTEGTTFTVYVDESGVDVEIRTPEELINRVGRNVNGNYKLANDIDMAGIEFNGIGSASDPFTGNFDGNGHLIKNVTITGITGTRLNFFTII